MCGAALDVLSATQDGSQLSPPNAAFSATCTTDDGRGPNCREGLGQPTISSGLKKKSISIRAFSELSEPWTEFASIDSA